MEDGNGRRQWKEAARVCATHTSLSSVPYAPHPHIHTSNMWQHHDNKCRMSSSTPASLCLSSPPVLHPIGFVILSIENAVLRVLCGLVHTLAGRTHCRSCPEHLKRDIFSSPSYVHDSDHLGNRSSDSNVRYRWVYFFYGLPGTISYFSVASWNVETTLCQLVPHVIIGVKRVWGEQEENGVHRVISQAVENVSKLLAHP